MTSKKLLLWGCCFSFYKKVQGFKNISVYRQGVGLLTVQDNSFHTDTGEVENYVPKTNKMKYRPLKKAVKSSKKLSYEQTYTKAVNIINYCPRTRSQLFYRLVDMGALPKTCDDILDEFEKIGLVNDIEYARNYMAESINIKKIGAVKIRQHLLEKGVSFEIVDEVLQEYDYDKQLAVAIEFVERKLPSLYRYDLVKKKQKLYLALTSRGFSYSVIQEVIENCLRGEEYSYTN